jgi:hypothetical protein
LLGCGPVILPAKAVNNCFNSNIDDVNVTNQQRLANIFANDYGKSLFYFFLFMISFVKVLI